MPSSECWTESAHLFGLFTENARRSPQWCGATRICRIVIASTEPTVVAFLRPLTRHAHFHTNTERIYIYVAWKLWWARVYRDGGVRALSHNWIYTRRLLDAFGRRERGPFWLLIFEGDDKKQKRNETFLLFFSFFVSDIYFLGHPLPLKTKLSVYKFTNKQSGETSLYVLLRYSGPTEMARTGEW